MRGLRRRRRSLGTSVVTRVRVVLFVALIGFRVKVKVVRAVGVGVVLFRLVVGLVRLVVLDAFVAFVAQARELIARFLSGTDVSEPRILQLIKGRFCRRIV